MKTTSITIVELSTKDLHRAIVHWLRRRGVRCSRDDVELYRNDAGWIRGQVQIYSDARAPGRRAGR